MTDNEIRERFKGNSAFLLTIKKKTADIQDVSKLNDILRKYVKCPKCKAPIEKIEG